MVDSKSKLQEMFDFFRYQNRLKTVLRNNCTSQGRKESSAEHSWSVSMMVWFLSETIAEEKEVEIDQNKAIKMALIHDLVEIDAGDVGAWDQEGRDLIEKKEDMAINNIKSRLHMSHGSEVYDLWLEHNELKTLESKLVKACDQLCPLVYRVVFLCSYKGTGVDRKKLDSIFLPIVSFSTTLLSLYIELAQEIEAKDLFDSPETD